MRIRNTRWLTGIVLTLACMQASAEGCHAVRQAILPLSFTGFVPTVPATINGNLVRMGIDTGSTATLLTPETVERFHLRRDLRRTTFTRGVGGASQVSNVSLDRFGFGGASELMKSLPVISIGGLGRNSAVAGLIGTDILSDYDVELSFPAHRLTLYRIAQCRKVRPGWGGRYMALSVSITEKHRFLLPVKLNGRPITAIFDTGAIGMRLSRSAALKLGVTDAMLAHDPQGEGYGVGDLTFLSPTHQFEQLKIGGELFHSPHIGIVDIPFDEADMLIGEDYMRSRRFLLSYSTHTLYVQPLNRQPSTNPQ